MASRSGGTPLMKPPSSSSLPNGVRRKMSGHKGPVYCVRFNSKGTYCMTGGQDRSVKLWNPFRPQSSNDPTSAYLVQTYSGAHGYEVKDVAITGDNSRFASVGGDRMFFLWEVQSAQVIRRFPGHLHTINTVAFNQEGTVVVTGSYDKTVKFWDLRSHNRDPIQVLSDFRDSVTRVWVTEEELVATSVDGCVRTYDLRTGKVAIDDCHEPLSSLSLSNDGKCVIVSGLDGAIRLMERVSGELLNTYRGHENKNYPVECCFNHTDAYILSGSEDGSLCMYDLVTSKMVGRLKEHTRALCSLSYHPTGTTACVVTASYDGKALVWGNMEESGDL